MFDLMLLASKPVQPVSQRSWSAAKEACALIAKSAFRSPSPCHASFSNPELIEKVVRINTYHMQQFAYFLGKLKSTPDGDGTLLDHSQIVLWQRSQRRQSPRA